MARLWSGWKRSQINNTTTEQPLTNKGKLCVQSSCIALETFALRMCPTQQSSNQQTHSCASHGAVSAGAISGRIKICPRPKTDEEWATRPSASLKQSELMCAK